MASHPALSLVADEPADLLATPEPSEAALVARARAADAAALRQLYERHAPAVMRLLRGLLREPAAAADATQETFARAFRRLDTLRAEERVAPWLFGIARNVWQEQRRSRRRLSLAEDEAPLPERRTEETPEVVLLGREAAQVVERALARLGEERRTALLLRLDHGLAYQEIAEVMGWSLAKVKVEIHRGRNELREELSRYGGGEP